MIVIRPATDAHAWDSFLGAQRYRPFLQSWTMGEVYRDIGQEPVRLEILDDNHLVGICFGHVVPAKRGRHLAIPYGPVLGEDTRSKMQEVRSKFEEAISDIGKSHDCSFIRLSPFVAFAPFETFVPSSRPSPLHLLAEHLWYLPLQNPDPWADATENTAAVSEESIFMALRKTTRNLIRRAEKEGVTIEASKNPIHDLPSFITLHDETRKRHGFTAYTNAFFRAQVAHFSKRNECTLYLARYNGEIIATSVHMHAFGETSYHHGASSSLHHKIPASYLLQWTAICDARKRNDRIYNFWGIAPRKVTAEGDAEIINKSHPFAGVTLFKTGFGGKCLDLVPCQDIPLKSTYHVTRTFEQLRKWKRGF